MTTTFKSGDHVIGIGYSACGATVEGRKGRIGTVDRDPMFPCKVTFEGLHYSVWCSADSIKADPAHAPKAAPSNPFKVGDKVRYQNRRLYGSTVRTVKSVGDHYGHQQDTHVTYMEGGFDRVDCLELYEAAPAPAPVQAPKKGHVVMKLDTHGFPQPAKHPVLHATFHDATAEAQRLSKLHLGERFAVFSHVGTARTTEETRTITDRITGFTLV